MTPGKGKGLTLILLIAAFLCYSFYLYASMPAQAGMEYGRADKGKLLWQRHNCIACHQVYGLGGFLGPDLTNTYHKKGPDYIRAFLANGTTVMPKLDLTDNDIDALIDYMKAINASGNADPRTFTINKDGTIEQ